MKVTSGVWILAIAFLLTVGFFVSSGPTGSADAAVLDTATTSHGVIRVNNDSDLYDLKMAGVCTGAGTEIDPYIIANYEIDADGNSSAIFVGNTTAHLVIMGCDLYGAVYLSDMMHYGGALTVYNSTNVLISGNYCHDCSGDEGDGIDVIGSNHITVINNTCPSNYCGVLVYGSDNITVEGNICNGSRSGMIIEQKSHNNTIASNNCTGNTDYGIYMNGFCNGNSLIDNNCSNDPIGIFVGDRCRGNAILSNTCLGNGDVGIKIDDYCDHNVVMQNKCIGGSGGILVDRYCKYNVLFGNNCSNGVWGIYLSNGCCNNSVVYNTCDGNTHEGICLLSGCNNNSILRNTCDRNGAEGNGGIVLYQNSNFNMIYSNTLNSNSIAIYFRDCANNNITYNTCLESTRYGIFLESIFSDCRGNNISDNTVENCHGDYNIYIGPNSYRCVISNNSCVNAGPINAVSIYINVYSHNCTISDNMCGGSYFGVSIHAYCQDSLIMNNLCDGNSYGIYASGTKRCAISNNTCSGSVVGIYIQSSDGAKISDNICSSSLDSGIRLESCTDCIIENNTCTGSDAHGILLLSSDGNVLSYNFCYDNGVDGVFLADSSDANIIFRNTLKENDRGLVIIRNSCNNQVFNNTVCYSRNYGVYISINSPSSSSYCNGNQIYGNTFFRNNHVSSVYNTSRLQAYDDGNNNWDTGSYGNYWSDLTSPDADGDGIVDRSYAIAGGSNADRYPLTISLKIVSPDDGEQVGACIDISGTASAEYFGVREVSWFNAANNASGTCSGTESWSGGPILVPGSNLITVTMTDENGARVSRSITIVYDPYAPVLTIGSPTEGGYANSSVKVAWSVEDNLSGVWAVKVRLDDGKWVFVEGVNYVFEGVSNGQHVVYLEAVDRCGNSFSTSVTFNVDATDPVLNITSPSDGYYNNTGSVQVKWTASDSISGIAYYMVSLDGVSWHKATSTSYTFTGIDDGAYTIFVRAYDNAGNVKESSVNVTVDREAPTAVVSPSGDGQKLSSVITVEFSETMDKSTVVISVSRVTGTVSWDGTTATFTPSSQLAEGTNYLVTVIGKDLAGNAVSASQTFKTASVGSVSGRLVDVNGEPMANVTVMLDNGMSVRTDADGKYLFENVSAGAHELSVEVEGYDDVASEIAVTAGETADAHTFLLVEEDSNESNDVIIIAVVVIVGILALAGAMFAMKRKA